MDNRKSIASAPPASKVLIWELGLLVTVQFTLPLTDVGACSIYISALANGGWEEVPLGC